MLYQTGMSPCYSCHYPNCRVCKEKVYAESKWMTNVFSHVQDIMVERLWRENVDIAWDENEDGELVLGQPWHGFPVGEFTQDDWFYWVDKHHSKGVGWVYENISPYDFEKGDK